MSKTLTPRELLKQNPGQIATGSVLDIEADMPLEGEVLDRVIQVLDDNSTITALEVITPEDESLGIVPLDTVFDYIQNQPLYEPTLGGRVSELEGSVVSPAPLFQCDHYGTPYHQAPPYQRLVSIARAGLKCPRCGKDLQRVK